MVKFSIKIYNRKWLENLTRMNKGDINEFSGSEQFDKNCFTVFQNSSDNSILRTIVSVEKKKSGSCYYR